VGARFPDQPFPILDPLNFPDIYCGMRRKPLRVQRFGGEPVYQGASAEYGVERGLRYRFKVRYNVFPGISEKLVVNEVL